MRKKKGNADGTPDAKTLPEFPPRLKQHIEWVTAHVWQDVIVKLDAGEKEGQGFVKHVRDVAKGVTLEKVSVVAERATLANAPPHPATLLGPESKRADHVEKKRTNAKGVDRKNAVAKFYNCHIDALREISRKLEIPLSQKDEVQILVAAWQPLEWSKDILEGFEHDQDLVREARGHFERAKKIQRQVLGNLLHIPTSKNDSAWNRPDVGRPGCPHARRRRYAAGLTKTPRIQPAEKGY